MTDYGTNYPFLDIRMTGQLLKNYKTEINPAQEQREIINKTIGTCRYIHNFYLGHNKEIYGRDGIFLSGYIFQKWPGNEYIPDNLGYIWIKKQIISN